MKHPTAITVRAAVAAHGDHVSAARALACHPSYVRAVMARGMRRGRPTRKHPVIHVHVPPGVLTTLQAIARESGNTAAELLAAWAAQGCAAIAPTA